MGREIKRVPLDFDWPLDQRWKGFIPPDDGKVPCTNCVGTDGRPTGYSRLGNSIYSLAEYGAERPILPRDATDLAPEEIRFMEALSNKVAPDHRRLIKSKGLQNRMRPYVTGRTVTDPRFMCYDIMQHLAKTLRVSFKKTFFCEVCKGECKVIADPIQNRRSKGWRRKQPPKGEGWQVWETVSEGSPVTPVFATADELIEHLCTVGDTGNQYARARGWEDRLPSREAATRFVKGSGWVPSMVITENADGTATMLRGVEAAILQEGAAE